MEIREDEYWMRRAMHLARNGYGHVSPNPAVGCVIVSANGKIVGEGWHRRYGEGHAEVNAVNSVKDRSMLDGATVYVTLEPCSHYGKTPPCAELLAGLPVKRVVAGSGDPDPKVNGRGLAMLRKAGKEVVAGVLEEECKALNPAFFTSRCLNRPFITLKWACGADGSMGDGKGKRMIFSNAEGNMWAHRERTLHDAIMVGLRTALADNPHLDVRHWSGRKPVPVVVGGEGQPIDGLELAKNPSTIWLPRTSDLKSMVRELWTKHHLSSLLVEGGATLLRAFLDAGLYDRIRREMNPDVGGGDIYAPPLPDDVELAERFTVGRNSVEILLRSGDAHLKRLKNT